MKLPCENCIVLAICISKFNKDISDRLPQSDSYKKQLLPFLAVVHLQNKCALINNYLIRRLGQSEVVEQFFLDKGKMILV